MLSDARKRANHKYNAKAYDRIEVKTKKGTKDIIKSYADSIGKSLNGYINDLIISDMIENGIDISPEYETRKQ